RLEADEEHGRGRVLLERANGSGAASGLAVEADRRDAVAVELPLDEVEVLGELGEDQRLRALVLQLDEALHEQGQLAARTRSEPGLEQTLVAGRLSESQEAGEQHRRAALYAQGSDRLRVLATELLGEL